MRVMTYPDGDTAAIGEVRWDVEWWTIRPGVDEDKEDGVGPDDLDSNHRPFKTEAAAVRFAKKMAKDDSFHGVATVQKQIVEWFVDGLGEWSDAGRSVEVEG